jgi:hypothetical protein
MTQMIDYHYGWTNGWRWAAWFLRHGRLLAALRQLIAVYVTGYIGETCERCGRRYFLWHAPDDLWTRVTGHVQDDPPQLAAGLWCADCFDRAAQRLGIDLRWTPKEL